MQRALLVLAGLMGAAGVVLAAAGAHANASVTSASSMLLFHALAIIGTVLGGDRGLLHRRLADTAAIGFALGAILFAGDLSLRAFAGQKLFAMAAPGGGFVLIASWLLLAIAAAVAPFRK